MYAQPALLIAGCDVILVVVVPINNRGCSNGSTSGSSNGSSNGSSSGSGSGRSATIRSLSHGGSMVIIIRSLTYY